MGTLVKGRLVRAIQEKIFINTKTKQKSGSGVRKTSAVSVGASDTLQASPILVGVGLNRGQYIRELQVNAAAAIFDPATTDALMHSRDIKKKFRDVEQWYGFRLASHPGPQFDTSLTIDPFAPDVQVVPIVAWYEQEGLGAKHWLYGYSIVSQPDEGPTAAVATYRARPQARRRPKKK